MAGQSSVPDDTAETGGWWDSWLSSAKTKSAEVYSMVKKDLDEIGTAVRSEASHVYSTTSNAIGKTLKLDEPESTANVMKKSFSTFLGQVNTVLNPEPDDEDTEVILSTGDTTMLSTYKKELEALQRLDATFLVPADSPELDAWRSSLEDGLEGYAAAAAAARARRPEPLLDAQHEKLVPSAVTDQLFWERYLFRMALLQDRLAAAARRQAVAASGGVPADLPASTDPVLAHLPLQSDLPVVTTCPEKSQAPAEASSPSKTASLSKTALSKPASLSKTTSLSKSASTKNVSPVKSTPSKAPSLSTSVSQSKNVSLSKNMSLSKNASLSKNVSPERSAPPSKAASLSKTPSPVKTAAQEALLGEDVDEGVAWEDEDFASDVELTEEQQTVLLQEYEREIVNKKQHKVKSARDITNNNQRIDKPIDKTLSAVTIRTAGSKPSSQETGKNDNKACSKSDICGNNLVENYFEDENQKVDDASSNSDESWEKEFEIEERVA